ncbi:TIM barrel oxidoreductase NifR3 [Citrifermentans bemidjiense Bem]|uniref:tRNA-dihydrouridine synthase n=1 Tax=Citrifermentans bemidjiense (strain ATCC BAA-1014 / DSM 16622 / JCM 12645 / Bem) TaxID=404380 RepID=B5EIA9_CITBB|nr:tRNA dihydrouridine synthase DusB [Citrifermentans bemidjiense]ACH39811.1 TIM barrel oxidoreductase NifR3 [Citrifermentans bemidjiense Bem]
MQKTVALGPLVLKNQLFLAPMAGITNLPMRIISREGGASFAFTEMVSVNGLTREGQKSFDLLKSSPEDRPIGMQLFGDDPEMLAEAARLVEEYGELIDINMGCPVRKVVGTGAGSALMKDPQKVGRIVRSVRAATKLPLTIKIRTGWVCGDDTFLEVGRIAQEEGCDAVTLHPRSRAQMFEGKADWSRIGELKSALSIPVIGSGDLFSAADAVGMLAETGCDSVMVARGAMGNPWIFREALSLLAGEEPAPPTVQERLAVSRRHLELFAEFAGGRVALMEMRKHLSWYSKGLPGAAQFRAAVNRIESAPELIRAMEEFFDA